MSQRTNGALLAYFQLAVKVGVAFLCTPVIVRSLGQEGYGLFSTVGAMAAYLYLLDFGLNDGILRFLIAHEHEPKLRHEFLTRALGFYAILGGLVFIATILLMFVAPPLFTNKLSAEQLDAMQDMVFIIGTGAAIMIASNPLGALLTATERFVFLRGLDIIVTIVAAVLTVILLYCGFGIRTVVAISAGSMIVQVIARMIYIRVTMRFPLRFGRPKKEEVKRVSAYAAPIFISMVADMIFWKLDYLVIGVMLGTAAVAIYAIGHTFNKYFISFATAISRVMTPEIVRQIDKGGEPWILTELLVRISRLQALALLLVLGGLIVFGRQFLILWLGPDYASSYYVMLAVLCPYAIEMTGSSRNVILQVRGLYWYKSTITLIMALINIPLTIWLVQIVGVLGAALSTGAAILLGYLLIGLLLKRGVGLPIFHYWRETARGILPTATAVIVAASWIRQWLPSGWLGIMLGALLFTLAYLVAMMAFGMNIYERGLVRGVLVRGSKYARGLVW